MNESRVYQPIVTPFEGEESRTGWGRGCNKAVSRGSRWQNNGAVSMRISAPQQIVTRICHVPRVLQIPIAIASLIYSTAQL